MESNDAAVQYDVYGQAIYTAGIAAGQIVPQVPAHGTETELYPPIQQEVYGYPPQSHYPNYAVLPEAYSTSSPPQQPTNSHQFPYSPATIQLPSDPNIPSGYPIFIGYQPSPDSSTTRLTSGELIVQILDYEVTIEKWISQAWGVYKQHWGAFFLLTFFFFCLSAIPYVGPLLALPLRWGYFVVTANKVRREGHLGGSLNPNEFFQAYYYFLPILILSLLVNISEVIGFFLLIVPGLYLLVALTFAVPLYLEYGDLGLSFFGAMKTSAQAINKQFCGMLGFFLLTGFLSVSGILLLGVGLLVTFPFGQIALTFAFRDIFGFRSDKPQNTSCVCV